MASVASLARRLAASSGSSVVNGSTVAWATVSEAGVPLLPKSYLLGEKP
jgi:hypothetical protein